MTAFGGLDLCACKRGFFTLRDCANSATATCSDVLAAHLPRAPHRRRASASSAPPSATRTWRSTTDVDRLAPSAPAPAGTARAATPRCCWGTSDPYWNDTDYRWYDDPGDDDDDDGGGFGDS